MLFCFYFQSNHNVYVYKTNISCVYNNFHGKTTSEMLDTMMYKFTDKVEYRHIIGLLATWSGSERGGMTQYW